MTPDAREQRLVFGEVADRYDRVRPGYPPPLVDDVLAVTGVGPGARVLEVGSGTGKATELFAGRGVDLVCLEPDAAMAAIARRRFRRVPGVRVVHADFESWQPPPERFDLLIAAQSWHWTTPGARIRHAAAALRPTAWVALWWNRGQLRDTGLRDAVDAVYRERAPDLAAREPGSVIARGARPALEELREAAEFADPEVRDYDWSAGYSGRDYVDLLATQSDHRMLPPAELAALLGAVGAVVGRGTVDVAYRCRLLLARRAERAGHGPGAGPGRPV